MVAGFDEQSFDDFFDPEGDWRMGRLVSYERSHICACKNANNGQALPGCNFCFGVGHCYDSPIKVWIGVSGYDHRRDRKEFGPMPVGTSILSIPHNARIDGGGLTTIVYDDIDEFDRFVLLNDIERRQIPLIKDVDDNHLQGEIVEIIGLRISRGDKRELTFVEGTDFVISGQRVRWLKGPIKGQGYVLDVRTKPTLYIFGADVAHRNHGGKVLPKRITAAPAELFDRARRIGGGTGQ
jgi:hypothetical protein